MDSLIRPKSFPSLLRPNDGKPSVGASGNFTVADHAGVISPVCDCIALWQREGHQRVTQGFLGDFRMTACSDD